MRHFYECKAHLRLLNWMPMCIQSKDPTLINTSKLRFEKKKGQLGKMTHPKFPNGYSKLTTNFLGHPKANHFVSFKIDKLHGAGKHIEGIDKALITQKALFACQDQKSHSHSPLRVDESHLHVISSILFRWIIRHWTVSMFRYDTAILWHSI